MKFEEHNTNSELRDTDITWNKRHKDSTTLIIMNLYIRFQPKKSI